ncbi:MAG: ATPase [marine bacterium B5-7]|nr:MAG: ATPase [marine bacterium B5-7]
MILLTGPRQVGKTTLLRHIDNKARSYITFDDLNHRIAAEQDPAGFVERLKLPVLLDEVQYAPSILPYIKMVVDNSKEKGLFWLTGSQQFEMMQGITESLAGRVAVIRLQGISLAEEQERMDLPPFLPTPEIIKARQAVAQPLSSMEIYHKIWRGGYPDVVSNDAKHWEQFYESYLATYIQRDIRDSLNVTDPLLFHKFMQITAARTGQLVNYRDIAQLVGVSEPTVKSWLNILHASGIIYLLSPYFVNQTKRLIKTPKLYFMDTGLCAFLTGWLTPEVLERGAMSGHILETYVIAEIIKSYFNAGKAAKLYFYRDKEKREIDLLIEENGTLYPIEIKKTSSLGNIHCDAFKVLGKLSQPIAKGCVICLASAWLPINKYVDAVPLFYI